MAGIHQLPQRVFMERQMLLQALGRLPYRISTPEAAGEQRTISHVSSS